MGPSQRYKNSSTTVQVANSSQHTSLFATRFIMQMGSLEIVIQDHATLDRLHDHMRHASYGVVHAVLLCFDISSPVSFENVEHKVLLPGPLSLLHTDPD